MLKLYIPEREYLTSGIFLEDTECKCYDSVEFVLSLLKTVYLNFVFTFCNDFKILSSALDNLTVTLQTDQAPNYKFNLKVIECKTR
jgi:hypothetical protein